MFKKDNNVRELPNQQKSAYLSVMYIAIFSLIILLRIALIGFTNEGLIFHWVVVGLTVLLGLFIQNHIAPVCRLSSIGFRALGLLLFSVAMAIRSWSLSTNPLFILSIFLMTVRQDYRVTW